MILNKFITSGLFRYLIPLLFASVSAYAQQKQALPEAKIFAKLPEKFSQRTDKLGFLWQVDRFGALSSGETQYLPSGLKLSVSGIPFQPQSASLKDGAASNGVIDLDLVEKRKDLTIKRAIWFDLDRGGVRNIDEFINTGKTTVDLKIDLKTTYPFSWQNLHGTDGSFLNVNPEPVLGDRDFGVLIRFSQTDGRHDTLFLTSSEKGANRPRIEASSNSRELGFLYEMKLAAGKSRSLVHWLLQRDLADPSDTVSAFSPFFQGRRLVDSRVPSSMTSSVWNFERQSFPKDGGTPLRLDSLLSLNEFIDSVGVHRRDEDILLVSTSNQLVGKVDPSAEITVGSSQDAQKNFSIKNIAAIQGGGGIGRVPRIFLRDGRVFSGPFQSKNLSLKVGDEWTVDSLRPEELNILLCSLSQEDGIPPAGTGCFVKLRSGEVLAVSGKNTSAVSMVTPWGPLQIPVTAIDELGYVTRPGPRFRLVMPDGSRLSIFIPTETIPLTLASGEIQDVPSSMIARIWKEGRTSATIVSEEDYWLDFGEMPEDLRPDGGFLLSGNNILIGDFEGGEVFMIDGAVAVKVATAEIVSIRRLFEEGTASRPGFEIELKNGDTLSGDLRTPTINVRSGKRIWEIPVAHLIAYRSKESK